MLLGVRALLAVALLGTLLLSATSGAARGIRGDGDPVFSPDGKTIAFVRLGATHAIMLVGADGKHVRTLVPSVDASGLQWSPDGSTLVYSVNNSDIWRANAVTGATMQLTHDGQYSDWQPSWSADGAMIAYDKFERCFRCTGIWVMNIDGTNQHEIAPDDGRRPIFSPTSTDELAISDSPQGRVIDVSGATLVPNSGPTVGAFTTWSPRGTHVAYMSDGLWVESVAALTPRRISKLIDGNFSWSPEGRVFAGGYNLKVALLRAKDGSHFTVLPNSSIYGGTPSWANGFVAYVHAGYCGIDLAREDGTHIRELARTC